ncbi:sucrose-phosphate phosphatase [Aetokthonos hydrillicola Thurmond2011]|jgi:hypothetical protein|uniref:sucrose-phosphate phosphatase n=1 Tax=Aetokthonos hydrillicola Thurmond2011 TaxID=2712845 RepID=A0AAP5IEW7_9CYAN|nr:sucrose-phosphate phosphatase [Aetokthonos hydrillicola]MBO3458363.1 sucrose-phosphate phosphatase [Aetokthonos hydrillicola CCALA 1050]MBW4586098.1 sucrose-phosphate phosphatase [Aetokthonos hydrillicola CCALA 1050]MDR9897705.1 sucrose-phosphate phosphatase [Aetokthonos hydrillicola Thurmond2011]
MKLLFVTDLDNTLVGNERATTILNQRMRIIRDQIYLVYATNYSYLYSCKLIKEAKLLQPDYLITSVGSEIYKEGVILDQEWAGYISKDWDVETILAIAGQFSDLKPHPKIEQTPWRISLCLDKNSSLSVIDELRDLLNFSGLKNQIIFSNGRNVDILPEYSNKGNATAYLQQLLKVIPADTLVCGDSGNDISLFEQLAMGIIVSNAETQLLSWYYRNHCPWHYLAQYPYAAGIIEGLLHFDLFPDKSWCSLPIFN